MAAGTGFPRLASSGVGHHTFSAGWADVQAINLLRPTGLGDVVRLTVDFGVTVVAAYGRELDPGVVFVAVGADHHVEVSLHSRLLIALPDWMSSTNRHRWALELPGVHANRPRGTVSACKEAGQVKRRVGGPQRGWARVQPRAACVRLRRRSGRVTVRAPVSRLPPAATSVGQVESAQEEVPLVCAATATP